MQVSSTLICEDLDLVPHTHGGHDRRTEQLLAGRESLLRLQHVPARNGTTESGDKIAVHRLDWARRSRSAAMLLFEGFCFLRLSFQVGVYLRLICMVVGKGGMNLRQR